MKGKVGKKGIVGMELYSQLDLVSAGYLQL